MSARRTALGGAVVLLGLTLLAPTSAATAAGETCRGEAATIVGAPRMDVVGTEGRDVVVTNQSQKVQTFGGDDLVCITGPDQRPRSYRPVDLDTGDGNDVVDGTAAPSWPANGELGAGSDTFYGGGGTDYLDAGTRDDTYQHVDTEHDVLLGGGQYDLFTSGQAGQPNTDVIDLGAGDDYLTYNGIPAEGSSVVGGAGQDDLSLSTSAHTLVLDNSVGRASFDGHTSLPWSGVEGFTVRALDADPLDLTFWGTGADESLAAYIERGVVRASMAGGKDTFITGAVLLDGTTVDGGAHRDLFYVSDRKRTLSLDLEASRLVSGAAGSDLQTSRVEDFEDAELHARTAQLKGDTGHNDLGISACSGTVRGRSGNDEISRSYDSWFETRPPCGERYVMNGGVGKDVIEGYGGKDKLIGGPGDDTISGKDGADTIVGGTGRDKADGGPGHPDRCVAEKKTRCER